VRIQHWGRLGSSFAFAGNEMAVESMVKFNSLFVDGEFVIYGNVEMLR
jgi:hypothetical protein